MIIAQKENYILRTWEASDAESLAVQLNNKRYGIIAGMPFRILIS